MSVAGSEATFDTIVIPHLSAGHRLARWLVRDEHDAQDVVQEASLRAWRYFETFSGGDGKAWFLRIVRNICYSRSRATTPGANDLFDEETHSQIVPRPDPETLLLATDDASVVARAMRRLPERSQRLLVLRELEGLSYRELSETLRVPIGTVMSRLSRAREALRHALAVERDGTLHPSFHHHTGSQTYATCAN